MAKLSWFEKMELRRLRKQTRKAREKAKKLGKLAKAKAEYLRMKRAEENLRGTLRREREEMEKYKPHILKKVGKVAKPTAKIIGKGLKFGFNVLREGFRPEPVRKSRRRW